MKPKNTADAFSSVPRVLAKKLTHVEGRDWCGYLIPSEIILISELKGIRLTDYGKAVVADAREKVASGVSNPRWFYFSLGL